MSLEDWQVALRREYGRERNFKLKNIGAERVFSEYAVANPESGRTYRVAIRGEKLGDNYCSCPDFSVNTLGTCKHIEFALSKIRRRSGGKAAFARGFQPGYSEVYLRYGAKREVVFSAGAGSPGWLSRLAARYFDDNGTLRPGSIGRFDEFLRGVGKNGREVRCYEDAIQFIARLRDDGRRRELVARMFPRGAASAAFEKLLRLPLYSYQREGALFAAAAGRALIADDMGLGKTIQAIAAAEILAHAVGLDRVLVIAPTSLKHQWKDEIEKFSGRTAEIVEGLRPARSQGYSGESFYKIANYETIRGDLDLIENWGPDLIVLDEAQRIKNWKTKTARSVKQLSSEYAFVLTGTPLQNRLEELHSIVEFVDRFRLGPSFRFLDKHQHVDEHGRVVGYRNLSAIAKTLEPVLIRRTKDEVLKELPERLEKTFFVEMTEQQMSHHEENRETVARIVAKWRRFGFLSDIDQRRLMIGLQNMRMSCNSTYLLDRTTDFGVKADETATLLDEIFEQDDAKVVVFSQWVRTHELLARRLEARRRKYVLFHGGVPGKKRKDLIRRFQEDPEIRVFLSTDAGGVGLNLQNASVVLNMDLPWNPAVLEQRIGRVHRLGQSRPVRVVHFIAQGTIEHGMLNLLKFKKSLFAGVLDRGQDEVFLGGTRLKRFMESVEAASASIPESVPAPETAVEEEAEEAATPEQAPESPRQQAWSDIVSAGLALVEKIGLAVAAAKNESKSGSRDDRVSPLISRDETGRSFLKFPLPEPETLQKIADLLGALAGKK